MSRWFRINTDMLDDFAVQKLSGEEFRKKFLAAMGGETNEFNRFVVPDPQCGRLPLKEWAVLRSKIFARDGHVCGYCGVKGGALECDHIYPISKGGSNSESNLITACRACNRSKKDKTDGQWKTPKGAA